MDYLLLATVIFCVFAQNILQKQYAKKAGTYSDSDILFTFFMALFASILLGLLCLLKGNFTLQTIPYTLIFAVCFSGALLGQVRAIMSGPLSLTALFVNFALLLPTIYGVAFLEETLSFLGVVGLIALCISIPLINKTTKDKEASKRWLLYAVLAMVGNGGCQIVQKVHQMYVPGNYALSFQFLAMLEITLIFGAYILWRKPKAIKMVLKKGSTAIALTAIANVATNLIVLTLAITMQAAILYPSISAGGIILTFVISFVFYKERYATLQYIGYLLGFISIVLLSL